MYVVLAGGVGAARFLSGLAAVVDPATITAIVNTGDDMEHYGLLISPDIDTVLYTLAGLVQSDRGWGVANDSFSTLSALRRYGEDTWFMLGDKDLALHLIRTGLRRSGVSLADATKVLAERMGIASRILPMTEASVGTIVQTPNGDLDFQEYFVRRRHEDTVLGITLRGLENAQPAEGVLEALEAAEGIIIAPSNPFVSIGTILLIPGVRDALVRRRDRVAAVSPIIGGAAIKGPAAAMLQSLGHEVSALGVARLYQEYVGTFILDLQDQQLAPDVRELNMNPVVTQTIMRGPVERAALAQVVIDSLK